MALWNLFALVLICQVSHTTTIKLTGGQYEDIVIAINPKVKEDHKIIENSMKMVKDASKLMYTATGQRLFIKNVLFLIPATWPSNASYIKPKTETYDKAHIIINKPFPENNNEPYTLQYGGCGEPGKHIHFTSDFLKKDTVSNGYGPRGKVFVHEWAHFRWGVFDESNNEEPYYIDKNGQIEATRCSLGIVGTNKKLCNQATCPCLVDPKTGLYEKGCFFIPEKKQKAQESLMYLQALPTVCEFCNETTHNIEAPNMQNRLCNYRSTWEVIMDSDDIKSTPPRTDTKIPDPTFVFLQHKDRIVTLVLDTSGSMAISDRIGRLRQASGQFVTSVVGKGSHVGIVQFSSSASIISNLLQINNEDNRIRLQQLLPRKADGGTNICSGIKAGLQVNTQYDRSTSGTELILLSDGEDKGVSSCFSTIRDSGAIIHVIALGPSAAKELEQIADMTGGLKFSATDKVDANGLIDAFSGISAGDGDTSEQIIQLESTSLDTEPKQCLSGTIFIDPTVGKSTVFVITYQSEAPTVILRDPNRRALPDALFIKDKASKTLKVEVPGIAQEGAWQYTICSDYKTKQAVGITVNSKAADDNVPPITVTAHMNRDQSQYPSPMVVYAVVTQGQLPVKGANVTAFIEQQTGDPIIMQLLDNGAGVDNVKDDGVYSKRFCRYNSNGRYSLKVSAVNKETKSHLTGPRSHAGYASGYEFDGEIFMNPPRRVVDDQPTQLPKFSRTCSGGSFVVTNVPSGPRPDIYKPDKISDLEAKMKGNSVMLYWTATGDDLDEGTASSYELRMSTSLKELKDNFNNCASIDVSSLKPKLSGSRESFNYVVPKNTAHGTILYFCLRAIDKVSQKSDLSNIVRVAVYIPAKPSVIIKPFKPIKHMKCIFQHK
ncbi:calcium-activated chloride channel regulator 1-like [Discoglossus pictus]